MAIVGITPKEVNMDGKAEQKKNVHEKRIDELKKQKQDFLKVFVAMAKHPDPTNSEGGMNPGEMFKSYSDMFRTEMMISEAEQNEQRHRNEMQLLRSNQNKVVGLNARIESDEIHVTREGAMIAYEIDDETAEQTIISVVNKDGMIVGQIQGETEKGIHRLHWDGIIEGDAHLMPDTYRIIVTTQHGEGVAKRQKSFAFPKIHEIEDEGEKSFIIFDRDGVFERLPYDRERDTIALTAPAE